MIKKMLIVFALVIALIVIGGFIAMGVWDMPVAEKDVQKPVDITGTKNGS